ncbi:iron-sulfur cluster assembly protein SufD [Gordonia polyisoprenivorans NBRC 16320 = JCM 10675]|uniref:Fe-S cluster assembly protein SufD n=1 Tax=Gordonia polyisoprenivorans TaxID=84595 RepID=A0A846WM64_9ACTN|nr:MULTISPECIES: Fe-S cluster assembly protein SufD [Gordonia]NKY02297.1 Fe-S cluster assembly protein SufD [Gordonia polyisoprenivorans]OPX15449.1 Fe-S cluster assembly protein SufD [Gordonia sp. i37]OZC30438.1 Fe-S cluster assembly protein SufD [Gordonia polyisoprenivorans]WCB39699.1 Fe-S cluster assembly protein SufD [Gordonia polyisoprenivorans]GAB23671.1 iron-sulfur cluster assembly protein SufD [Gordonia polyisoprenivorans NBRC 16320 = JCM 10675]
MADPTLPVVSAGPVNKGEQFTSFDVNAFEVPSPREEAWRFTPFRRLRGLHDGTAERTAEATVTVGGAGDGVTVDTVGRDDERLGQGGVPFDRIAAQAYSSFTQATVVTVGREVELGEPVTIEVTGPGEGQTAFGHLQIRLEPFARAVVVLDQKGGGTYAENVEFVVGDSAALTVVNVHDWADDAVHVAAHHLRVGRDATVRHFAISLGGNLVRLSPVVHYDAPGGDVELWGLYFADAGQHLEQRLLVDHSQPNCRSNVVYKGALQGDATDRAREAHTVWIGDVLIRPEAEGTDTFELNRNLVLTDGARADSVPNLEIETGEIVGAGHASATGRFDDEQLFYLQARGIPEDQARRLVIRGFFGEIIAKIAVPELRERLEAAVEAELEIAGA